MQTDFVLLNEGDLKEPIPLYYNNIVATCQSGQGVLLADIDADTIDSMKGIYNLLTRKITKPVLVIASIVMAIALILEAVGFFYVLKYKIDVMCYDQYKEKMWEHIDDVKMLGDEIYMLNERIEELESGLGE